MGRDRALSRQRFHDAVLIAPKRSKYLDEDVAAFRRLRDIGVVVNDSEVER